MMKWVVTRGPYKADASIAASNVPICDKENYCVESIEMLNNNSNTNANCCNTGKYLPHPKLVDLPVNRNSSTPLSSLNSASSRPKKLRTRRERNKALVKRLTTAVNNNNLSDTSTPRPNLRELLIDPMKDFQVIYRDKCDQAATLQNLLNSSPQSFNEREVKTPEGPSPSPADEGHNLCRQRAVRRKHCKPLPMRRVVNLHETNDSANSLFNSFVFRELTEDVLI
ncbi:AAEL013856-PA [Aedes aegypti]|uniref:AAEL013856-PA n=2 Tax=Aedes aegypti TaxID=7159 RepID=A0A1S4G0D4_AEDAE|nr:uncharacterized protein LOC5579529 [Aedes aegypti]EAT32507.1 AAEL013856-PA [Aedes aegypti]